ncbi:sporulation protein [Plantactinospora endophytica]|uniref:Sporulation protein n=1 Tax=Plantactinospora endophytica TaxID=673535 RepID=A0ABQ4DZK2_9ACTN|nr:sporulation protein [Plantactinospora endophytica]GIG87890.1 sporulation protein [Plantactinospora endophytica]
MVFKKMLGAFGVGAPAVDTVLPNPNTRPGLALPGQVNLTGGGHDVEIERISVSLVTRIEVDGADEEYDAFVEFHRADVSAGLHLREGQELSLPFQIGMPWETPVTDLSGQRLHGMTMGLRTEVSIRGTLDKGDLDLVHVYPLPVQERILEAFGALGFRFKGADLERGHIYGLHQSLPFYQEIEFFAAPQYAHGINEVELSFVTDPHGVQVVLEFDKRAGLFTGGQDSYGRYRIEHGEADRTDWAGVVDGWLREALEQHHAYRGSLGGHSSAAGYPPPGYGHGYDSHAPAYGHGYGGHGHHEEHHDRGPGMGGVLAGAAGGAALGFAAGMVADDIFDGDEEEAETDEE